MSLRPGDHIGSYCLVAPLGRGGQSSVWRALDAGGNHVALKVLHIRNDETLERLRREAAALATVHHPSLVRCSLLVEDPNRAIAALVLELVEGALLAEVLARGPIQPHVGEWILRHVAGALAAIHAAGHVHRDLTTRNVLVRPELFSHPSDPACVKVIDLGIAAIVGNPKPLTDVDMIVGTAPYLPPEIVDPETWPGQPARPCGDVFAFGVLAMEVLHGRRPAGVIAEHTPLAYAKAYAPFARSPSRWPPDLPADRHELLLRRCLALRAADRPRDGAELVELLRATRVDLETTEKAPALGPVAPVRPMRTMPDADAPGESPPPTLRDARVTWRAFGVAFGGAAAVLGVLVFALTRPTEDAEPRGLVSARPAATSPAAPSMNTAPRAVAPPPATATVPTPTRCAAETIAVGAVCVDRSLVSLATPIRRILPELGREVLG